MYCPWDVLNYARDLLNDENLKPQNYWANTSSNDIIKVFVRRSDLSNINIQFEKLLNGESIYIEVTTDLNYNVLTSDSNNIWSILLMTGYVTPACATYDYDNESLDLILCGKKNSEVSLYDDYVLNHEPLPIKGDYAVICNDRGDAVAVIETKEVNIKEFSKVSAKDELLEYAKENNIKINTETLCVEEKFEVVYK